MNGATALNGMHSSSRAGAGEEEGHGMTGMRLKDSIRTALERSFPNIPVSVGSGGWTGADGIHFRLQLLAAGYERQREGRYTALYRFRIGCVQAEPEQAEVLADGLRDILAVVQGPDGERYRSARMNWEAGEEGRDPAFSAEYALHLVAAMAEPAPVRMKELKERGTVK